MNALPAVADLAVQINTEHERAFGKAREALEHARRAGELLLQAKAAVDHGQWLPWLAANVAFSERTAQGYMRLAARWDTLQTKSATVADLGLRDALKCMSTPADPGHGDVDHGDGVDKHDADQRGGDDADQGDADDHDVDDDVDDAEPQPRPRRRSRVQRWNDAIGQATDAINELIDLQNEYQEWGENLPENLQGSNISEKLDAVVNIDLQSVLDSLNEAQEADLPLGFGRD